MGVCARSGSHESVLAEHSAHGGAVHSEQPSALQHGLGLGWLCRPLFGGAAGELHVPVRVCVKGSSGILLSQV